MSGHDFEIMSGDTLTAVWQNWELRVYNEALLPLYLKTLSDAELWLMTRAIDCHRPNSRLLKKALRLTERDDLSVVISANGVTVTDNYWIRPIGSDMRYADVAFTYDYFAKRAATLALGGSYAAFDYVSTHTGSPVQELTNTGSFEKCWRLKDGQWWMYKKATQREQFSELFVYRLGRALGINTAEYIRGDGIVKTPDFTGGTVNFEPAFAFMGENEDYEDVISALGRLCPAAVPDYIRMIFLDTVTANPDRHTGNFGLLRDKASGELLGLAPAFDHNMALISRGYPRDPKTSDMLIAMFSGVIKEHPDFAEYIPAITEDTVRGIIDEIGMKVRKQAVIDLVMNRYNMTAKEI